jgi:hypothetical protein
LVKVVPARLLHLELSASSFIIHKYPIARNPEGG